MITALAAARKPNDYTFADNFINREPACLSPFFMELRDGPPAGCALEP